MPRVTNNSQVPVVITTKVTDGNAETETLQPRETKDVSCDPEDIHVQALIHTGAIVVEGTRAASKAAAKKAE